MGEEALVTISEIQAPNLDVLVGGTGGDELRVRGNVHVEHRQLVTIQREEMFKGVGEEDFDGVVEEGEGDEFAVGRVADAEDVVADFEDAGADELEFRDGALVYALAKDDHVRFSTVAHLGAGDLFLDNLKVPKDGRLVGRTGHETFAVGLNLQRPYFALVSLDGVHNG